MKKIVILIMAVMALCACDRKATFTVEGTVEGAKDSVLYFENMSLSGVKMIDSVKLAEDGRFCFHGTAPDAPDFFILRIHDQIINLAVDSTETIKVSAKYPDMSARYEVAGSDDCANIRELALRQQDLYRRAVAIEGDLSLGREAAIDSLSRMTETYKREVAERYIFPAPGTSTAYFALFQTLGRWLIFDQTNSKDLKVYAAVATSWDTFHPNAERTQNLHNIVIEGMKNQRIVNARDMRNMEASKIEESGVIEIDLPDNHGRQQRLTSLKGKVVLLDFHIFVLKDSPQRILMLRDLYNKYHDRGLEIYQVSLDQDEHFWRQMTTQLPWICVRDDEGVTAIRYNVQSVPEFFLIDRQNMLQKRSSQMKDLEAEIKSLL